MTWHLRHTMWLWCNFPHLFFSIRFVTYFATNFYGYHTDSATVLFMYTFLLSCGLWSSFNVKNEGSILSKLRYRDGLITVLMRLIIPIIIYFCTLLCNVGKVLRIRKIYKYFIKMCDSTCFQFPAFTTTPRLSDLIFFLISYIYSFIFLTSYSTVAVAQC